MVPGALLGGGSHGFASYGVSLPFVVPFGVRMGGGSSMKGGSV